MVRTSFFQVLSTSFWNASKSVKKASNTISSQHLENPSPNRQFIAKRASDIYKWITRKLAIFVGSSNMANLIVENLEFKDLVHALDP